MLAQLLVFAILGEASVVANVRPQIGYVYPPGGRAGTTIDVRLGTYDWTSDMQLFVHDPRVKIELAGTLGESIMTPPPFWYGAKAGVAQAPLPREVSAKITIAADVPPGPIRWQAANANGATDSGTFIIGDGASTAEFVEAEKTLEPPQLPSLPVTVSGRISKITEIDRYRFVTPAAGIVTCKLVDDLGKPFNGVVAVREDAASGVGPLVTDNVDTVGNGAVAMFTAKAGAKYVVEVFDADHAGDRAFVYRLTIEQGPRVLTTLPVVAARGTTANVEVIGWGVATGALKLESTKLSVAAPNAKDDSVRHTFTTAGGAAKADLFLADAPDMLEPATTDPASRRITVPARVSASLEVVDAATGMAVDRYRFAAKKGDVVRLAAQAVRFGSPVDPSLVVVDAEGKELIRNDDLGLDSIDAAVDFTAPADGDFDVLVSDFSGTQPSRAHVYRLVVDNAAELAEFDMTVPDFFSVAIGGKADFVVKLARRGGWKEPIEVDLENLPEGMTVVEEPIPPAAPTPPPVKGAKPVKPVVKKPAKKLAPGDQKLSLTVAEDAAATARPVIVVARTMLGDKTIERRSRPIVLAATMKPRCCIKSAVQDGGRVVSRGTTYPADVIVERLEGFTGPVTLRMAATQSRQRRGLLGPTIEVAPGVETTQYPVYMPEWLETNLTARINVFGVTEVADPKGNKRQVTGAMDGQIVMSYEGALLKVSHEPQERVAPLGAVIEIPVKVSRSPRLPQEAKLELIADDDYPGLFTAETQTVPKNVGTVVVKVRVAEEPRAVGKRTVKIRATVLQDGRWPAISETAVPVTVEAAPTVATKTASAK